MIRSGLRRKGRIQMTTNMNKKNINKNDNNMMIIANSKKNMNNNKKKTRDR